MRKEKGSACTARGTTGTLPVLQGEGGTPFAVSRSLFRMFPAFFGHNNTKILRCQIHWAILFMAHKVKAGFSPSAPCGCASGGGRQMGCASPGAASS